MRKHLFSVTLVLGLVGGLTISPLPMVASVTQAQIIQIKSRVVDQDGQPLIGATVKTKGSNVGTVTDLDGNFQLNVPANAVLLVSYVGYKESEVAVRGRAIIDQIQLTPNDLTLNQVVVVGYGTQKKADLTGSVSIVNAEEMKKVSNSNISTMLEGKVPGVQITTDGQPGADPTVRVRGIGSFGSTAPLYVIDGVPVSNSDMQSSGLRSQSILSSINPNDIESMTVLKDAAASSLYGSRAANGVIIITTKKGKEGKTHVNYDMQIGWSNIAKKSALETMNSAEMKEKMKGLGLQPLPNTPEQFKTELAQEAANWAKAVEISGARAE